MFSARSGFLISLSVVVCVAGASAWLSRSRAAEPASSPPPQTAPANRIEQLRAERHQVLEGIVEMAREQHEKGIILTADVQETIVALRMAELETCKTPAERVRIHEQIVEARRIEEKDVYEFCQAGRTSRLQSDKAKADRLKAEIDLEQARLAAASAANPKSPQGQ